MIEFKNNPKNYILFGDSRGDILKAKYFKNQNFYNFSYGGGSLYEEIDSFWYAAKLVKLEKVILSISFEMFNLYENKNLAEEAKTTIDTPYKYYMSFFTSKVSLMNLYSTIFNKKINVENPNMNKEEFWSYQINYSKRFYQKYKYPTKLVDKIKLIAEYCDQNNIELSFFIPPGHTDLIDQMNKYNRSEERKRFKKDLRKIGKVYDFDFKNEFTQNKENFGDPFHISAANAQKIANILNNTLLPTEKNSIYK